MKVFEVDITRNPQSANQFNDFMRLRRRMNQPRPLLIHHKMDGCPYCIRMHPMWRQLTADLDMEKPHIQPIELNRNSLDQIEDSDVTDVRQFPTMQILNGNRIHTYDGSPQVKKDVELWIDSILPTPTPTPTSITHESEDMRRTGQGALIKNFKKIKSKGKRSKGIKSKGIKSKRNKDKRYSKNKKKSGSKKYKTKKRK
jgi:hypothetical protein